MNLIAEEAKTRIMSDSMVKKNQSKILKYSKGSPFYGSK